MNNPLKLVIAALLLTSGNAFAQPGISAGLNLANYSYGEKRFDVQRKTIMAYNVGLQYRKPLTERLFLLPELSYTVKGTRIYYDYPIGATGPMKRINRLNYIQLAVPIIVALPVTDEVDFEAGAAPFLGYLASGTTELVEFDGASAKSSVNDDDFKKGDAGVQLSTGFRLGKKLGFHAKYHLGLINIQYNESDPAIKTRNFSLNISWLFTKTDD